MVELALIITILSVDSVMVDDIVVIRVGEKNTAVESIGTKKS